MRWAGHIARMEKRRAYKILDGKPEEEENTRKTQAKMIR
jgi:hypothetical protein